jgi:hypothetical protein
MSFCYQEKWHFERINGTYLETIQNNKIWDSSDPESSQVRPLPTENKGIGIAWLRFCRNRANTSL